MLKKIGVGVLLLMILGVGLSLLGVSPLALQANLQVAAGMGAKLACSGRYLSGLNETQMLEDLASYSPFYRQLSLRYDDTRRRVSADMFGLYETAAQFRPGLGCTLEIGDTAPLNELVLPVTDAQPGSWPAGDQVSGTNAALNDQLQQMLAADNKDGQDTRALVAVRDGVIVAEAYAPGFDHTTPLLGWSMGKSLTSIMLGRLSAMGQLSVEDTNLFAQWAGDERRELKVEHLLHMASGLEFSEVYAPGSDATRMLFTEHSASAVAMQNPIVHPPGSRFYYSSGTTNLLMQLLVDRLGGPQRAIDFLHHEILAPLGMRHSVFEPDPSGVFVGSSYIYASGRDWARLGLLMLNNGVWQGKEILERAWVERSQQPNSSANDPRYGYQFWLNSGGSQLRWPSLPTDAYAMSGNRAQTVMIIPSNNTVLVRLGWSSGRYPMEQNFARILATMDQL